MIGSKHANILNSTVIVGQGLCRYHGQPVIELFGQLYKALEAALGSDGASLLALPESGFSKTRRAKVITWYTDRAGPFRAIDALSQEECAAAEALLRERLQAAIERIDDASRAMFAAALNIASREDILFDGEAVVLTNWGLVAEPDPARADALPSPISPYLPAGFALAADTVAPETNAAIPEYSAPALNAQPVASAEAAATVDHGIGSRPEPQTAAASIQQLPVAQVPLEPRQGRGHWEAAYWLSGVALLLALFLLYLIWPGNLVYPQLQSAPLDGAQAGLSRREENNAMRDQISRLQGALQGNICTAQNTEALDGIAGLPVLPPMPSQATPPAAAPDATVPPASAPQNGDVQGASRPAATLPGAAPAAQAAGNDAPTLRGQDLIGSLEKGTVLVVGSVGDSLSLGSGFLVSSRYVLTNHHVVEGVEGGNVLVANSHLPSPLHARVVAMSPGSNISSDDFALLELERETDLPRLSLSTSIERLDSVIAAGYPSFVVSSDPSFVVAFQQGKLDSLSSIQLALTRGEVTAMQPGESGTTVLAHSATISKGNSGGPLVDRCGRIVGINTYTKTDAESALRLNYALSAEDAIRFLNAHGVDVTGDTAACADAPAAAPVQSAVEPPSAPPLAPVPPGAAPVEQPATPAPPPVAAVSGSTPPAPSAQVPAPPPAPYSLPQTPASAPATPSPSPQPAPQASSPASAPPAPPPPSANEADDLIAPTEPAQ
ncbi:serine protease [Rhizobium leguminosarum]|uniref:Serine protease n=1 Tax=Rhizobium leguminosarum TaxID=384 RepID=A0A4Q8XRE3_RHILE|nr:serine protease [Rhizobium leguminosarum]TAX64129.1 serine protease [Rhizobium leguminosarum]